VNECSICSRPGGAAIVNQLLYAGKHNLQEIADECGFSKSAVHRHSHGQCPQSFVSYRAAMVKSKGAKLVAGRMFVQWPGQPIPDEVKPNDVVLVVRYRETEFCDYRNPAALVSEDLLAEAHAENLQRFPNSVTSTETVS
jgi:hypothetical protein